MSHCQGDSCGTHGAGFVHSHSHSHGFEESGCCGKSDCPCSCSCCQKSSCQDHQDQAQKLIALADLAWMEVLKERMKEYIKANDSKIDEMAQVVCEVNRQRWHNKISQQKCSMEYEQKLKSLLSGHEGHCQHTQGSSPRNGDKPGNGGQPSVSQNH